MASGLHLSHKVGFADVQMSDAEAENRNEIRRLGLSGHLTVTVIVLHIGPTPQCVKAELTQF